MHRSAANDRTVKTHMRRFENEEKFVVRKILSVMLPVAAALVIGILIGRFLLPGDEQTTGNYTSEMKME